MHIYIYIDNSFATILLGFAVILPSEMPIGLLGCTEVRPASFVRRVV